MNETKEVPMDTSLVPVPFHGNILYLVDHDNEPYTPMKPIVEGMGLGWSGQHEKLNLNRERWGIRVTRIPSESGEQETLCMPLRKLPGWLMSIQVSRLKPEIREKALAFQNECDDVLWKYWTDGRAPFPSPVADRVALREEVRKILAEDGGQGPPPPPGPDFDTGIRCLDGLARWAAEKCGRDACIEIDWFLRELYRTLETGRERLRNLEKAERTQSQAQRRARDWRGSGFADYVSAEVRKGGA